MVDLRVELYGHLIGHLVGTDWRTFDFKNDPSAFDHFQLDSTVLSVAVPLAPIQNRGKAERRRTFFAELLPEGDMLASLAAEANVPTQDVIGLLSHFGRDVAGALQIYDPTRPGEPRTPSTVELTRAEVGEILQNVQATPLGNHPVFGKSSLAGVQDKIVLARINDTWNQPLDGYPSTHIIKSQSKHPTGIFDEEYGARIVRELGLGQYATGIEDFAGVPGLVIERYDRSLDAPDGRIHQEDMNQALGARGPAKYQETGGQVSLARMAKVFWDSGDAESVRRLLVMTTAATAMGNLDMHAKNVSIIHYPDESMAIAPAYDMVPQVHQKNDGRVALAIDREYVHSQLTSAHLVREGDAWGLRGARGIVEQTLEIVRAFVRTAEPHPLSYPRLVDDIEMFTVHLLEGKEIGHANP